MFSQGCHNRYANAATPGGGVAYVKLAREHSSAGLGCQHRGLVAVNEQLTARKHGEGAMGAQCRVDAATP